MSSTDERIEVHNRQSVELMVTFNESSQGKTWGVIMEAHLLAIEYMMSISKNYQLDMGRRGLRRWLQDLIARLPADN